MRYYFTLPVNTLLEYSYFTGAFRTKAKPGGISVICKVAGSRFSNLNLPSKE